MARYVVGVSGASGSILAYRLMQALTERDHEIELVMSQYALYTASLELGKEYSSAAKFVSHLPKQLQSRITISSNHDVGSAISSGSYPIDGMVIIPCSMATVGAIAAGLGDNAIRRAADVSIKEKRGLIIVPREAPFSQLHLENLLKLAQLGAMIIPPVPAWYTSPTSLEDVENFIVGKVLDGFQIEHNLYKRWKV